MILAIGDSFITGTFSHSLAKLPHDKSLLGVFLRTASPNWVCCFRGSSPDPTVGFPPSRQGLGQYGGVSSWERPALTGHTCPLNCHPGLSQEACSLTSDFYGFLQISLLSFAEDLVGGERSRWKGRDPKPDLGQGLGAALCRETWGRPTGAPSEATGSSCSSAWSWPRAPVPA